MPLLQVSVVGVLLWAREYVHPDGTIDEIDFECRR